MMIVPVKELALSAYSYPILGSQMGNDVVSLPLRCSCLDGVLFNLLITFYKEGNYMVLLVTCKQYYRAITPHVNAIKTSLLTLRIMTV